MSGDNSVDPKDKSQTTGDRIGNDVVTANNPEDLESAVDPALYGDIEKSLSPDTHESQTTGDRNGNDVVTPNNPEDLESEVDPALYGYIEKNLPPDTPRDYKIKLMKEMKDRHMTELDQLRVEKYNAYRKHINLNYQPLKKKIYSIDPSTFFDPAFIDAITQNTSDSLKSIISEPSPGVYVFRMLQPEFCALLLSEVENFEKWAQQSNFKIMPPNTMNKYGVVLDDFGLESMLDNLMEYIRPITGEFFPEVGGGNLDSHHGFVVEYGKDRDYDLGFHVDDSEVTLNVCLGKEFSGGELFFRGVRCGKHVNTGNQAKEVFDYSHSPGFGVLHHGQNRHGARPTTSGHRTNLLLWCRSSVFRGSMKYRSKFPTCKKCYREEKGR